MMRRPEFELRELGDPSWPRPWREISTMTVAFGHGMAVSPLQLGVGGGVIGQWRPTGAPNSGAPANLACTPEPGPQVVSEKTSKQMRYLMRLVVGIARRHRKTGRCAGL